MKNFATIMVLALSMHICVAQPADSVRNSYDGSGASKLLFVKGVAEAEVLAAEDIRKGKLFLFLQSGISPVIYSADSVFESLYMVVYIEKGCTGPESTFMAAYNTVVFSHLQQHCGKKWKRQVQKDVIGYRKWRQNNSFLKIFF